MNYEKLLRRHWPLLLIVPVLATLITYFATSRIQPQYASTATVVVLNQDPGLEPQPIPTSAPRNDEVRPPVDQRLSDLLVDQRLISTYLELVKRRPVLEQAAAALQYTGTVDALGAKISASNPDGTQLVQIRVEDENAESAAAIANAVANSFINLSTLEIASSGSLALVEPAAPAAGPFSPNMRTNVLLALILSLAGACALAVLLERVDTTIRSPQDVLDAVNLPTMAVIPIEGARSRQLAWVSLDSPWANAFRGLRASLTATGLGSTYHSLLLTSETGGVGKSVVAANLAVAYANAGFKVMLIDLDLIRPTQHQLFGVSNDVGIATELSSQPTSSTIPLLATEFENLALVPAGLTDMNPDDILALGLPDEFLRTAYQRAEIVIVDGPALSDSAAAMVLPRNLDAALVVVAGGESTQGELRRVVERLEVAPASILGVVINKSSQRLPRVRSGKRRGGIRPLSRSDARPPRARTPRVEMDDAGVAMSTTKPRPARPRQPRKRQPHVEEPQTLAPVFNPTRED